MPEGDTIYRTAESLRPVLDGRTILSADSPDHSIAAATFAGRTVRRIETRGKHLLVHLDDGVAIHSHLGMTGSWHIYRAGQAWQKPRGRAALVLRTCPAGEPTDGRSNASGDDHALSSPDPQTRGEPRYDSVCFSPKMLERLSSDGLRRHPYLARLGPDLLDEPVGGGQLVSSRLGEEILARFRVHAEAPIGQAVMNQTIVCGIGNVYKSEVLFLCGVNPWLRVRELDDDAIGQIVETAGRLLYANRHGHPRRTRTAGHGSRLWVYGRSGQPCLKCGTAIQLRRQGDLGRTTYWCSRCQPLD